MEAPDADADYRSCESRMIYGDDEESLKLRSFFEKGNAYTLQKLQEKFAP
jgi:hypothetical protein